MQIAKEQTRKKYERTTVWQNDCWNNERNENFQMYIVLIWEYVCYFQFGMFSAVNECNTGVTTLWFCLICSSAVNTTTTFISLTDSMEIPTPWFNTQYTIRVHKHPSFYCIFQRFNCRMRREKETNNI